MLQMLVGYRLETCRYRGCLIMQKRQDKSRKAIFFKGVTASVGHGDGQKTADSRTGFEKGAHLQAVIHECGVYLPGYCVYEEFRRVKSGQDGGFYTVDDGLPHGIVYDGLEWGLNGEYLGWNLVIQGEDETWCNIYYNGAEATQHIISKAGQSTMNLNEKPRSAAEYCYNKNKRNDNGVVQGMTNSSGWFLPGIRQLEAILTSYYNTYPEFQNNFYWSSAAGKRRVGIWPYDYYEDNSYARATKALPDGGYAESDWDDTYTSENGTTGKAPRTGTYLRIRAAYVPPSGVTIE